MEILGWINDKMVWGAPMLILMLGTGIYFTARTGFFQIRRFPHILKSTVFSRDKGNDGISPFAAMCQALAATLGTGNIAGVSTALAIGGAGAVFWMWISALFGMMTGFAENVLGIYYRRRENGKYRGGAMRYIRDGLLENKRTRKLGKPLSVIYAVLCIFAGFGMGSAAQMNSASEAMKTAFGLPEIITGIALAALAALIVFGGVKRISTVTSRLVPFMSGFYIIGCLYIIIANADSLPSVFSEIFRSAFGLSQIGGGVLGFAVKNAISMGFKRGVFSNEAGIGTSVFAHSSGDIKEPVVCGMWSVFEVFFDTIVMCTLTALVLLSARCGAESSAQVLSSVDGGTQYFRLSDEDGLITDGIYLPEAFHCHDIRGRELEIPTSGGLTYSNIMIISDGKIEPLCGVGLAEYAFSSTFGKPAGAVLAVLVVMFAFSTVIGWSCFIADAAEFLFGERIRKPICIVFITFSAVGAIINMRTAWLLSDIFNGLMAIPNLIAVLCLSGNVLAITKNYTNRIFRKRKITPLLSKYRNDSP
ncbi:MAG: sodium:alanine symporter family protein [Oscillospiraceae bacterium]|nr:sodium:alanine symporter family protein [Oscillospiraceae bacterium]